MRVKESRTEEACSPHGEVRNAYKIFIGEPEWIRPLGIPTRRFQDNIKVDLMKIGMKCIRRLVLIIHVSSVFNFRQLKLPSS